MAEPMDEFARRRAEKIGAGLIAAQELAENATLSSDLTGESALKINMTVMIGVLMGTLKTADAWFTRAEWNDLWDGVQENRLAESLVDR